jgi:type 1 fimbria pilin
MKAQTWAFPMAAMAMAAGLLMGQVGVARAEGGTIRFEGAITEPTCGIVPQAGERPTLQSRCPVPGGAVVRTLALPQAGEGASVGRYHLDVRTADGPGTPAGTPASYVVIATYL